jgi:hypothetical protein
MATERRNYDLPEYSPRFPQVKYPQTRADARVRLAGPAMEFAPTQVSVVTVLLS